MLSSRWDKRCHETSIMTGLKYAALRLDKEAGRGLFKRLL